LAGIALLGSDESPPVELRVAPHTRSFAHPQPVVVQVFLYAPRPVAGARVHARLVSPSGRTVDVPLLEQTLVGATVPGSGSYATILDDLREDGSYEVSVSADDDGGRACVARPFPGDARPTSPGTAAPQPQCLPPFRVRTTYALQLSGYRSGPPLPPLKTTSFSVVVTGPGCIRLSWIVPASRAAGLRYVVRHSVDRISSVAAWERAAVTTEGSYTSRAGRQQERDTCGLPAGRLHFVLRSVAADGAQSELSNDYIAVLP
jgi:hypothetical protein